MLFPPVVHSEVNKMDHTCCCDNLTAAVDKARAPAGKVPLDA